MVTIFRKSKRHPGMEELIGKRIRERVLNWYKIQVDRRDRRFVKG